MKINFLTIFPHFYDAFKNQSIIKRALASNQVTINVIDFRKFAPCKHHKVDDIIYGGGKGMLLKIEPIDKALQQAQGKKILLTPQGQPFSQALAFQLSSEKVLTLVAGHYEGFDERIRALVDMEISIGDYVLTGGEVPSMVLADAIIRLLPGVIQEESHLNDSFQQGLLDYPQYTRPRIYKGQKVPSVLLNGNHAAIAKWRKAEQLARTKANRPDLYKKYNERNHNEK